MTRRPPTTSQRVDDVERVVVLRANGIGDYVFSIPGLDSLRAAYPDATITLAGAPWHAELLRGRPGPLDEVVVVPPAPGVYLPAGTEPDERRLESFFAEMQARRFDLAIQLHGGGANSNPFVARLGARVTAGMRDVGAPPLDRWIRYVYHQHEVLRYLEIVALVGAHPVTVVPSLTVVDRDRAEAAPHIPERPYAVLNPGATDPRRRWALKRWASVGDELAGAGLAVVIAGGTGDESLAEEIRALMVKPAESLTGRLGLGGLAALLEGAEVVLSNDTGPLHVAMAVGTPTVGIYWCGNLVNGSATTSHWHRHAVSWQLTCPVCGVDCSTARCAHTASFVDSIGVDEVLTQAFDLLGRSTEQRGGGPRRNDSALARAPSTSRPTAGTPRR